MDSEDDVIRLKFDLSDAQRAENEIQEVFNNFTKQFLAYETKGLKVNTVNELISASLRTVAQDGREAIVSVEGFGESLKIVGINYKKLEEIEEEATKSIISNIDKVTEKTRDQANKMNAIYDKRKKQENDQKYQKDFDDLVKQEKKQADAKIKITQARDLEVHNIQAKAAATEKASLQRQEKELYDIRAKAAATIKALEQRQEKELYDIRAKAAVTEKTNLQRQETELYQIQAKAAAQRQALIEKRDLETYRMDNAPKPKTAFDKLFNQASAIGTGILISQAFMRVTQEIKNSINAAAEFSIRIGEIRTLSQENQQSTSAWSEQIRALSDRFGAPIADVAAGTYEMLSNQIAKGANSTKFMTEAMKFAAVTVSSTKDSVNLLSSVLNAYNMSAEDTVKVSATLFKLIDLGRVTASQMADTFGQTAPIAASLGVSLNELSATYSVLTRQGLEFANASTYTRAMMLALLKPSNEMKKVFAEWGVASGDAAIKTFGWTGVLKKLFEEVKEGGLGRLTELIKNIRGIQGAVPLTTESGFGKFMSDLQQYKDSDPGAYAKTMALAFETSGKKLEIEFNKIKNFFIVDIGQDAVKGLVSLSEHTISLTTYVKLLSGAVLIATSAFTAYKTAAAFGAIAAAGPIGAIAAAVVAGGLLLYSQLESNTSKFKRYYQEISAASEQTFQEERNRVAKQTDLIKEGVDEQYQAYYKLTANIVSLYNRSGEMIKIAMQRTNEIMRGIIDEHVLFIQDKIKALGQVVSDSLAQIKESEKYVASLSSRQDRKAFRNTVADQDTDSKKVDVLLAKAEQLRRFAINARDAGNFDEYRRSWEEAIELANEALDIIRQTHKETVQEGKAAIADEKERTTLLRERAKVLRDIKEDEIKARRQLEDYDRKSGRNQLTTARGMGGKKGLNAVQDGSYKQDSLNIGEKRHLEDYIKKLEDERRKLQEIDGKLNTLAGKEKEHGDKAKDTAATYGMQAKVLKIQKDLVDELIKSEEQRRVNAKQAAEDAKKEQNEQKLNLKSLQNLYKEAMDFDLFPKGKDASPKVLEERLQDFQRIMNQIQSKEGKAGLDPNSTFELIRTISEKFKALKNEGQRLINLEEIKTLNLELDKSAKAIKDSADALKAAYEATQKDKERGVSSASAQFRNVTNEFSRRGGMGTVSGFEDIYKAFESINKMKDSSAKANALVDILSKVQALTTKLKSGGAGNEQFIAELEKLIDIITPLKELNKQLDRMKGDRDSLEKQYQKTLKDTVVVDTNSTAAQIANNVNLMKSIEEKTQKAKDYQDILNAFQEGAAVNTPNDNPYAEGPNIPPPPRYEDQLIPQQAGDVDTRSYNSSSTSVGDIHINVQGGNTAQATVREIGKELRRGIRRGTVKLN